MRRIKYTDEPLGKFKIVEDFLPQPEKLVLKEEKVKAKSDESIINSDEQRPGRR